LCCADFDGDHVVAGGDLGVLLNGWGDCADEGCTDDAPCDDDDPCTIDFCENGVCHHERIPGCGGGDPVCGAPDSGPCSEPHDTPVCGNAECCHHVCEYEPHCCDIEWDAACVEWAMKLCGDGPGSGCGAPNAGSCHEPNDTPACSNEACCHQVCMVDHL
jgi:hypothetical protein